MARQKRPPQIVGDDHAAIGAAGERTVLGAGAGAGFEVDLVHFQPGAIAQIRQAAKVAIDCRHRVAAGQKIPRVTA